MKPFKLGLQAEEQPRSVLHIGAGRGEALDEWADCRAITLVEPNPEMLTELRRRTADMPYATVTPGAAGASAGRAFLNIYTMPELSSLRAATGILELFPGLRVEDRAEVEVIAFPDILARHDTDDAGPNLLVLDAPGEEEVLLEAALSSDALERFDQITIHCGLEPLFEGSADANHLHALMESRFFELRSAEEDSWGRLRMHYRRNHAAAERAALEKERDALHDEVKRLKTNLDQSGKDAAAHEAKAKALSAEVDTIKPRLAERKEKIKSQNEALFAQESTVNRLTLRLKEAQRDLDAATSRIRLQDEELIRLQAQFDLLGELLAAPDGD